jgi:hypothetical protein
MELQEIGSDALAVIRGAEPAQDAWIYQATFLFQPV